MTAMICSSLNRLRFMGHPPSSIQRWKIQARNGPDLGEKVNACEIGQKRPTKAMAGTVKFYEDEALTDATGSLRRTLYNAYRAVDRPLLLELDRSATDQNGSAKLTFVHRAASRKLGSAETFAAKRSNDRSRRSGRSLHAARTGGVRTELPFGVNSQMSAFSGRYR
ncbi:MAG: hypothetical protein AAFR84_14055 [Pseudomonadota bacterium]